MASAVLTGITAGAASLMQLIDSLSIAHANYVRGDYVETSLIPVMKSIASHMMKTESNLAANSQRDNLAVGVVTVCIIIILLMGSLLFGALRKLSREYQKLTQATSILADKLGVQRNQDFPILRL